MTETKRRLRAPRARRADAIAMTAKAIMRRFARDIGKDEIERLNAEAEARANPAGRETFEDRVVKK